MISRGASWGAQKLIGMSGGGGAFASAAGTAGRGLSHFAGLDQMAQKSILGGIAGIGYGAIADDTSIIGGALMGAGLGAGIGYGQRIGGAYRAMRGGDWGLSRGAAARMVGRGIFQDARNLIGNTRNRAINGWNSLKSWSSR